MKHDQWISFVFMKEKEQAQIKVGFNKRLDSNWTRKRKEGVHVGHYEGGDGGKWLRSPPP